MFFGPLVPLFRSDWGEFIFYVVFFAILAYLIPRSADPNFIHYVPILLNVSGAIPYNKRYIRKLVQHQWRAATPLDIQKLTSLHIKVGEQ